MEVISMHDAKSTLSQLVNRAERGEVIYIGAYGKAQAKLVPITAGEKPKKKFGVMKDRLLNVSDDFDAPLPDDIIAEFEK